MEGSVEMEDSAQPGEEGDTSLDPVEEVPSVPIPGPHDLRELPEISWDDPIANA